MLRRLIVASVIVFGFGIPCMAQEVMVINLNDPEGTKSFGKIDKSYYKLTGKVKKLVIEEINGGSTVDCSELEVEQIECGLVDGKSKVTFKAKDSILFTKRIDGQSAVSASAGVDITIMERLDGASSLAVRCGGTLDIRDKIDGNSAASIICKNFKVRYLGDCTVDLDATGDIMIKEQGGGAKVTRKNLR